MLQAGGGGGVGGGAMSSVWHAWVGPTDRWSELRGFGVTGRGGLNRGWMGEPCPPMEEQRG